MSTRGGQKWCEYNMYIICIYLYIYTYDMYIYIYTYDMYIYIGTYIYIYIFLSLGCISM